MLTGNSHRATSYWPIFGGLSDAPVIRRQENYFGLVSHAAWRGEVNPCGLHGVDLPDFHGTVEGIRYKMRKSPGRAQTMDQERRRSSRYLFIASAEVHAETNGSRLAARISDIGVAGCYVDTINPLPDGTPVRVKIFNEMQFFEAAATVVYSHTHLGMGLKFGEVPPSSLSVLQNWLPAAV